MQIKLKKQHRRYSKYKNTGLPWLGEVPENWEVSSLRNAGSGFKNGYTANQIDEDKGIYVSRIETISTGKINYEKVGFIEKNDFDKRFLLDNGDILLSHINSLEYVGNIAQYDGEKKLLHGMNLLRIKPKVYFRFLYWFLKSDVFRYSIRSISKPAVNQVSVTTTGIKSLPCVFPSSEEQTAIADYLDEKTALLDRTIEAKQKQIELLKEKRTSLINQAVTRGIDENAEMKESGVEWIGEIPKSWNLERLKFIAPLRNKKTGNASPELTYIALENIESWTGRLINLSDEAEFESIVNEFEKGDVLFGKLRPYLAKVISADFKGVCTGELLALEPKKVLQNFLFYRLISTAFIDIVNFSTYGAKMPRASWNFIGNLLIAYPDFEEQEKIVAFLDCETQKIDQTIVLIEKSITLLEEYKTSLISNVVTGKINVMTS